ncbi:MAG: hypothetical protein LBD37_02390 [Treponema sp.]|jgi:hypothetical protein|nr:hypothetical protein [Treponema sp.]
MADKLLLGYTVLDSLYQNGLHKNITGDDAGAAGNFSNIRNPANSVVSIASTMADPVIFS